MRMRQVEHEDRAGNSMSNAASGVRLSGLTIPKPRLEKEREGRDVGLDQGPAQLYSAGDWALPFVNDDWL